MSDDFENDLTGSYVRFVGDGLDGEVSISPSPEGGAPIRKPVSPSEDNLQRLYALFRPLRLVMGCLGLWHPSLDDLQQAPPAHRCTSTTRFLFLGLSVANMTYSFCNFALLFLSRPAGRITSWEWSVYVVLVIWPLQACLMTLLHFWLFEWEFVGALWRVWAEAVTVRIGAEQWERLGRLRNLYMAGAVAATALLTGFVLIGMTSSGQAGAFLHTFLSFDFSTPLMVVNFTVLTMVIVATASFTTVFFVLHCHIVAGSLMSVYASMERRVTNNTVFTENVLVGERDMSVLEYFRQQRNWSKKMVDAMDRAFRHISSSTTWPMCRLSSSSCTR
ncbi:uncharacterized protein LOC129582182 isoform X1 [Paramacrobiotus metropolitanus]|uniref:uncharacterized protein LOC129582182 isoform X1 n=1 Tax=Paramacrobiotus metropolitanus TaxID=2943436 RepID=UPI0024459327|nr:uncharacterized protein LOC129582182 isoform X1 [Paramacrobiotus metropolitanus]